MNKSQLCLASFLGVMFAVIFYAMMIFLVPSLWAIIVSLCVGLGIVITFFATKQRWQLAGMALFAIVPLSLLYYTQHFTYLESTRYEPVVAYGHSGSNTWVVTSNMNVIVSHHITNPVLMFQTFTNKLGKGQIPNETCKVVEKPVD